MDFSTTSAKKHSTQTTKVTFDIDSDVHDDLLEVEGPQVLSVQKPIRGSIDTDQVELVLVPNQEVGIAQGKQVLYLLVDHTWGVEV